MEGRVGVFPVLLCSNGCCQLHSLAGLTSYALNWSLSGHKAALDALKKKIQPRLLISGFRREADEQHCPLLG